MARRTARANAYKGTVVEASGDVIRVGHFFRGKQIGTKFLSHSCSLFEQVDDKRQLGLAKRELQRGHVCVNAEPQGRAPFCVLPGIQPESAIRRHRLEKLELRVAAVVRKHDEVLQLQGPRQVVAADVPDAFREKDRNSGKELVDHRLVRHVLEQDGRQTKAEDRRRLFSGRGRSCDGLAHVLDGQVLKRPTRKVNSDGIDANLFKRHMQLVIENLMAFLKPVIVQAAHL